MDKNENETVYYIFDSDPQFGNDSIWFVTSGKFLLRGASPVNGSKNRYFFFIIIRLHIHSEIRM